MFVERGHPGGAGVGAAPGAAPAPQGDVVPRGNPGAGGATMQHGHAAGSPPAGTPSHDGRDHGGLGER
jgi:hypothetical protein